MSAPLAAGTRLGPYEITAKLGEGGMGEVCRATDTKPRRQVALKVLPAAPEQARGGAVDRIDVVLDWFEELRARVPAR